MSQSGTFDAGTPGVVPVETVTGNIGGAVTPDGAGNLNIVGSGTVTVTGTPITNTLTISNSGAVASSFQTDAGIATPVLGVLTVAGGTNIGSTGAGSTVTLNLDTALTAIASITGSAGASFQTGITAGDTLLLRAYNNTTATYNTFATLTANLIPTFDFATGATIGGAYIYRAGGTDVPVTDGGTGASTLADHGILLGHGTSAITSQTLTDGQLLIGKTGAFDPVAATITSTGGTITVTPGAGSLNIDTAGGVAASFPTDAGTATPALGVLTIAGGTNIASAGAGSTVTLNLDAALTGITSVTTTNGGSLQTGVTAADTLLLQAYDVDGTTYVPFATLTANNTPTMDLATGVTIAGNYIYRATGTDIPVTDGGTGVSTLTAYSVICGGTAATNPVQSVASLGNAGEVLTSNGAAALPTWQPAGGGGITWSALTVDAAFTVNTGTFANKAGLLTMTLPATAALGDIIEISNMNTAVGWRIAQNANQYIRFGSSLTTTGVGGYLEATQLGDSVKLVCNVAGASTGYIVTSSVGNITIV